MSHTLRERIIVLLKKYERLRNEPDKLIHSIWLNEISEENKKLSVVDFMTAVYLGKIKLTNTQTIDRTRREVQKEFSELAGDISRRRAKADYIRKNIRNESFVALITNNDNNNG